MARPIGLNVWCCRFDERLAVHVEKRSMWGERGREELRDNRRQTTFVGIESVVSKRIIVEARKKGGRGLRVEIRSGNVQPHSCVVRQGVHVVMGSFSIVALVRVFDDKLYRSRVQVVVGIETCH